MQKIIKNILILFSLSCANTVFATDENSDLQKTPRTLTNQSVRKSVKPSILEALKEETEWQNKLATAMRGLPSNMGKNDFFIRLLSNRSFQRASHEDTIKNAVTIQWGSKSKNSWYTECEVLGLTYEKSELDIIQNYHKALFDRPLWTEDELKNYDTLKEIMKTLKLKKGEKNANTRHLEMVWKGKFSPHLALDYDTYGRSGVSPSHSISTYHLEALMDYHKILYPEKPPLVSNDIMGVRLAQQELFRHFQFDKDLSRVFSIEELVRSLTLDTLSDDQKLNKEHAISECTVAIIDKNDDAPTIVSRKWINALNTYSQTLRGSPLLTQEQLLRYDATEAFLKAFLCKMSPSELSLHILVRKGTYSEEKGQEEKKQTLFVSNTKTYPQIEKTKLEAFERYAKALHPNNPLLTEGEWEKYDLQQAIFRSLRSRPESTHLKAILDVDAGTYDINLENPQWLASFAELFPSTESQSAFLLYAGTMNSEKYGFVIEEVEETSLEISVNKED